VLPIEFQNLILERINRGSNTPAKGVWLLSVSYTGLNDYDETVHYIAYQPNGTIDFTKTSKSDFEKLNRILEPTFIFTLFQHLHSASMFIQHPHSFSTPKKFDENGIEIPKRAQKCTRCHKGGHNAGGNCTEVISILGG
jgi:hypothetical protein